MKTLLAASLALTAFAHAELKLPSIIGDRMVLQQKQANPIWGWDNPDAEVTVHIGEQAHTTQAGKDGRWEVKLDAMPASSEPQQMTVTGSSEIVVKDILVGEVWLCSGQSNMGWILKNSFGQDLTKLAADLPQLRLMTMPKIGTQEMKEDFNGKWELSNAESAANFSAVGYYFGKTLHEILGVPVGLINNAWGGSAAEAWVQRDVLEKDGRFDAYIDQWKKKEILFETGDLDEESAKKLKEELSNQHRPGNLYAGTLHPVIGYGIRGTIWYQGETNAGRAYQYDDLMNLLITTWRKDWGQGDFPFYFVQLADFQDETSNPIESSWAELREAQTNTLRDIPNTGQAVITDLGAANDIHPREKRDVAERLLRWALAKDYGYEIAYRSPEFREMEVEDGKAILSFDHTGGGLKTYDVNDVRGFTVCGADGKWKNAEGKIIGDQRIEVFSKEVPEPTAVRYAWATNPVCNIVSKEGLPLTPFRTDDFPLTTEPKK